MMFQQAREAVVQTCLSLADKGYLAGTGGNIALRADAEHFLVTPSATDYYAMGAADICVIRLAGRSQVEGEKTPSVEAGMHVNVLEARPDCKASVHTHQPIASAYTLLGIPLVVGDLALRGIIGAEIPCVSYAPSGTGWLAWKVGKVFNTVTHACLMRSHGVVCVGQDIDEAIGRVAALEAACAEFFMNGGNAAANGDPALQLVEQTLTTVMEQHHQEIHR